MKVVKIWVKHLTSSLKYYSAAQTGVKLELILETVLCNILYVPFIHISYKNFSNADNISVFPAGKNKEAHNLFTSRV